LALSALPSRPGGVKLSAALVAAEYAVEFAAQGRGRHYVVVAGGYVAAGSFQACPERVTLGVADARDLFHSRNKHAGPAFDRLCHGVEYSRCGLFRQQVGIDEKEAGWVCAVRFP